MQALKATEAREIDKASITEAETLVFEGRIVSQSGALKMKPGEFYFRPNAVTRAVEPPWWNIFKWGSTSLKTDIVNTIVIDCPFCEQPILTTFDHHITQRSPLTIDTEISCPYSRAAVGVAHGFLIKEGNIRAA